MARQAHAFASFFSNKQVKVFLLIGAIRNHLDQSSLHIYKYDCSVSIYLLKCISLYGILGHHGVEVLQITGVSVKQIRVLRNSIYNNMNIQEQMEKK